MCLQNCDYERNENVKHFWETDHNFSWDQKKVDDRESRLTHSKFKETIHCLRNRYHISKISYMLPEIWLPNFNQSIPQCASARSLSDPSRNGWIYNVS